MEICFDGLSSPLSSFDADPALLFSLGSVSKKYCRLDKTLAHGSKGMQINVHEVIGSHFITSLKLVHSIPLLRLPKSKTKRSIRWIRTQIDLFDLRVLRILV